MRVGIVGANGGGALQNGDRLFIAPSLNQQTAQIVMRVEMSVAERQRAPQQLLRRRVAPAFAHDETQLRERIHIVGLQRERAPQGGLSYVVHGAAAGRDADEVVRLSYVWKAG